MVYTGGHCIVPIRSMNFLPLRMTTIFLFADCRSLLKQIFTPLLLEVYFNFENTAYLPYLCVLRIVCRVA